MNLYPIIAELKLSPRRGQLLLHMFRKNLPIVIKPSPTQADTDKRHGFIQSNSGRFVRLNASLVQFFHTKWLIHPEHTTAILTNTESVCYLTERGKDLAKEMLNDKFWASKTESMWND